MSTEGETLQVSVLPYRCCGRCQIWQFRQIPRHRTVFLFPVHAMFSHDCPLAVKPASTPWRLVHQKKKLREILYLLICSFPPCLSWLSRSRVRKFWRDELPCT